MLINTLVSILFGYLLGSIPTSVWVGRILFGVDVRTQGSGNAGATNVCRVLGWRPGLFVFIVDITKGVVAVWIVGRWFAGYPDGVWLALQLSSGLAALLGHVWPILAGFRGGKGIATLLGVLLVLSPQSVMVGVIVFAILLPVTHFVSVASLMAVFSFPCTLIVSRLWFGKVVPGSLLTASIFAVLLVFFTHRSNIRRLMSGVENRV